MNSAMRVGVEFVTNDNISKSMNKLLEQQDQMVNKANKLNKESDKTNFNNIQEGIKNAIGGYTLILGKANIWVEATKAALELFSGIYEKMIDINKTLQKDISANTVLTGLGSSIDELKEASYGVISSGDIKNLFLIAQEAGLTVEQFKQLEKLSVAVSNKLGIDASEALEKFIRYLESGVGKSIAQFGIVIDKTEEMTQQTSELGKVQSHYNALMGKTKDLQNIWGEVFSRANQLQIEHNKHQETMNSYYKLFGAVVSNNIEYVDLYLEKQRQLEGLNSDQNLVNLRKAMIAQYKDSQSYKILMEDLLEPLTNIVSKTAEYVIPLEKQSKYYSNMIVQITEQIENMGDYNKLKIEEVMIYENLNKQLNMASSEYKNINEQIAFQKTLLKISEGAVEGGGKAKKKGKAQSYEEWVKTNFQDMINIVQNEEIISNAMLWNAEVLASVASENIDMYYYIFQNEWNRKFPQLEAVMNESTIAAAEGALKQNVWDYLDTISEGISQSANIFTPFQNQLLGIFEASSKMFSAFKVGAKEGLSSLGDFLSRAMGLHKIFAAFLVPLEIANAYRDFAMFNFVSGFQHLFAATMYGIVAGQAIAGMVSGGNKKESNTPKMSDTAKENVEREQRNIYHINFQTPIFGNSTEAAVYFGEEINKASRRGLLKQ